MRETIEQLQRSMHEYMRSVRTLSDAQFLQAMNGWSPRDVTAHLIGWNRAGIETADAMSVGEVPSVLVDPGEDFADVNAAFVQRYDSADMNALLRELELSYQELARHLYTIDASGWTRPVQVPGWSRPVTLQWNFEELAKDYVHHRQEIEEWLRSRAAV